VVTTTVAAWLTAGAAAAAARSMTLARRPVRIRIVGNSG
jgi:hypothetical protein